MNKEILDQALLEFLNTVKEAKDFSVEHAPELVHQILTYKMCEGYCLLILGLIALIIAFLGVAAFVYFEKKPIVQGSIFAFFAMLIGFSVGICTLCYAIPALIKIHTAPSLFILEYARGLM